MTPQQCQETIDRFRDMIPERISNLVPEGCYAACIIFVPKENGLFVPGMITILPKERQAASISQVADHLAEMDREEIKRN